eukprot:2174831-Pyramimonas_sp.AAC.1
MQTSRDAQELSRARALAQARRICRSVPKDRPSRIYLQDNTVIATEGGLADEIDVSLAPQLQHRGARTVAFLVDQLQETTLLVQQIPPTHKRHPLSWLT